MTYAKLETRLSTDFYSLTGTEAELSPILRELEEATRRGYREDSLAEYVKLQHPDEAEHIIEEQEGDSFRLAWIYPKDRGDRRIGYGIEGLVWRILQTELNAERTELREEEITELIYGASPVAFTDQQRGDIEDRGGALVSTASDGSPVYSRASHFSPEPRETVADAILSLLHPTEWMSGLRLAEAIIGLPDYRENVLEPLRDRFEDIERRDFSGVAFYRLARKF